MSTDPDDPAVMADDVARIYWDIEFQPEHERRYYVHLTYKDALRLFEIINVIQTSNRRLEEREAKYLLATHDPLGAMATTATPADSASTSAAVPGVKITSASDV